MGSSCRHLAEPTFPPTNTFTPTATVAVTATKTPTSTVTGTPTSTITPGGPTFTPTSSPTLTPTSTITSTPSGPSVFQNFDGSSSVPTGWSSNNNNEGTTITVPALAISTAQFHSSPNSAWIQIPFTIAGESANIQYAYTSNPGVAANCANLTGKTISFYYYVDVAPSAGAYGTVWVQDGGTPVSPATAYDYQSYGFAGGTYAVAIGAWTQASIPANQGGVDPSDIWQFGIQIGTGTGTGSGTSDATVNFYIDDVTIQ
jgi:hypothetical protein